MLNSDIHRLIEDKGLPSFASDRLASFDHSSYFEKKSSTRTGTVYLNAVIGTSHGDYVGHSWLELLPTDYRAHTEEEYRNRTINGLQGRMKRGWDGLMELHAKPDYYLSRCHKNHLSFYKVGADYYIAEGNHRVVLARFFLFLNSLPEKLNGVSVIEFT